MSEDSGDAPGERPTVLASVGAWKAAAPDPGAGAGDPGPGDGQGRLRRRRFIVLAIVAVVVLAAVGGLLLATRIKSPAQQAAQTQPPPLTDLTATVQRTVLTASVLAQAVVTAPKEFSPSTVGSSGGGGSAGQNVQQIVTRIFSRTGGYVGQGTVILEVAGRPFFVLQGTVPAYRNLQPGESGQDVVQLQQDLAAIGYSVGGDSSGDYGPGTAAAVSAYYRAIGYPPVLITTGPRSSRGASVPLGEYTFVPQLPARVAKLGAAVGKTISSGLTLALGDPALHGQLNPADARLIRPGMAVTITEPGTGATIGGRVTSVSQSTASTASISGGLYVAMRVRPDQPLPMSLVGQDVSLTIAAARSAGPVLAVPEAAVFAGADGGTYVTRIAGATRVRVPVSVGMSGSGLLQVTPRQPGALAAGDRVSIGANYSAGGPVTGGLRQGFRG